MTQPLDRQTFPPGEATLLGQQLMLEGVDPLIMLTTADRKTTFYLSGGLAPWPGHQDGLQIVEMDTPTPEFKHLDSQGSRQDGTTWTDTVYEPLEWNTILTARATTAEGLSRVVSEWIAANDPKKLCRLEWFTPESGLWWSDVRLAKKWIDRIQKSPRRMKKQVLTTVFRNDMSFWQSIDSTSTFTFTYDDMDVAEFDSTLTDWPQYRYEGDGTGGPVGDGDKIKWVEDGTEGVSVMLGPYTGFDTTTDSQVVSLVCGSPPQFGFLDGAAVDLWVRCNRNPDGTWAGDGVRARITAHRIILTAFVNYEPVWEQQRLKPIPPFWGDKYTLIAGVDGNPRRFRILRNGMQIPGATFTEDGTASKISTNHRGLAVGMRAGTGVLSQISPSTILRVYGGDNNTETQEGFLNLTNIGDQDGYPQIVFCGPGWLEVSNGPGGEMITFAKDDPLRDGQIVLITTHPRYRTVVDLTPGNVDLSQPLTEGQKLIKLLSDLVGLGQTPPLLQWFESLFGIKPPQGVLYSLLDGRFTRPIPGVPQPRDATTSRLAVRVGGGNASTRVTAALTPMRRWPEAIN